MANILFALGHDDCFFYNTPSKWAWNNIPPAIQEEFDANLVSDVTCAAFGHGEEDYFFLYHKNGARGKTEFNAIYGDAIPDDLKKWLCDGKERYIKQDMTTMKVVLGPANSFVAWTANSIRWANIPKGLEATFQSWLSPAGWTNGPPRLVALGYGGAFFALSEYGTSNYSLPRSMTTAREWFSSCGKREDFHWSSIRFIDLCASTPDRWVIVHRNHYVKGNFEFTESFFDVAESIADEEVRKIYSHERELHERAEKEKAKAAPRAEKVRKAAKARREREIREQLELHYALWVTTYEAAFKSDVPMEKFPHIPSEVRTCREESCKLRKTETELLACRHDIERLLRASGQYSIKWLRSERLRWHPDRFGRKCHPDHMIALQKQATAMYAIFEELIADEAAV